LVAISEALAFFVGQFAVFKAEPATPSFGVHVHVNGACKHQVPNAYDAAIFKRSHLSITSSTKVHDAIHKALIDFCCVTHAGTPKLKAIN
jgi:hypothetical protein